MRGFIFAKAKLEEFLWISCPPRSPPLIRIFASRVHQPAAPSPESVTAAQSTTIRFGTRIKPVSICRCGQHSDSRFAFINQNSPPARRERGLSSTPSMPFFAEEFRYRCEAT